MRPAVQKKKKVYVSQKVSLWFNNRHILGPYPGLNQSEIVKGGPPLWLAVVQIFLYVCVRLKMRALQSDREKEVSSRDARSVANLARFSAFLDPHSERLRGAARSVKTVIIASLILHAK